MRRTAGFFRPIAKTAVLLGVLLCVLSTSLAPLASQLKQINPGETGIVELQVDVDSSEPGEGAPVPHWTTAPALMAMASFLLLDFSPFIPDPTLGSHSPRAPPYSP